MAKLAKDTPEYCYALADFITNYLYRCVKEDRADLPPKIAIVFPLSDLLLREKSKWQSDKFSTAVQYYLPTIMHYAVYNTTYHDTMAFIQMMKLWETYKVFPPDVMEKVRREVSRTTGFEFQKI